MAQVHIIIGEDDFLVSVGPNSGIFTLGGRSVGLGLDHHQLSEDDSPPDQQTDAGEESADGELVAVDVLRFAKG